MLKYCFHDIDKQEMEHLEFLEQVSTLNFG
jgi:hypothetical protein